MKLHINVISSILRWPSFWSPDRRNFFFWIALSNFFCFQINTLNFSVPWNSKTLVFHIFYTWGLCKYCTKVNNSTMSVLLFCISWTCFAVNIIINSKQLNCHGEIIIILASYFGGSGLISAGCHSWDICGFYWDLPWVCIKISHEHFFEYFFPFFLNLLYRWIQKSYVANKMLLNKQRNGHHECHL